MFVATSSGELLAYAPNGYRRWQVDLGQHSRPCRQLDGYGVSGTPVVDRETRAIYAVDPFGRLHALDLATGAERPGWPVRVVHDYDREHVYGGLLLVEGHVYVPTSSLCDNRMEARLARVSLATRDKLEWLPVPFALGGGGGMWGFAGSAYSPRRRSIFVATGNAFRGGSNVGRRFREWAGYGEQLVELSLGLQVRAASHPPEVNQALDLDFSSAPIVAARAGCPEFVAAVNKNGTLYGWRADRVRAGVAWRARLRRGSFYAPVIGQPAWSPRHRSFFFATGKRLLRIALTKACRPRIAWSRSLPPGYTQGAPIVARDTVWLGASGGGDRLLGVDARTGRIRSRTPIDGSAYASPAVVDGSLFVGTFARGLHGFTRRGTPVGTQASRLPGQLSFADALHGWESRESGVWATADAGASWRRLWARPAHRLALGTARFGVVETTAPARCGCRSRVFWTADGGRRWRETTAIAGAFAAVGTRVFSHRPRRLVESRVAAGGRTLHSRVVATIPRGAIVDVAALPSGAVALISDRVRGQGWDDDPRVLLATGGAPRTVRLPPAPGRVLVRSIETRGVQITVRGRDFAPSAPASIPVTWTSADGGQTWTLHRGT